MSVITILQLHIINVTSLMELSDYLCNPLRSFFDHCFLEGYIDISVIQLNLTLLCFILFEHDDCSSAFICFLYVYFSVVS